MDEKDQKNLILPLDTVNLAIMRTLLANERTFLAWCRTALGLIGMGFVLEKASIYIKHFIPLISQDMLEDLTILSIFAMCSGVVILIAAAIRFFSVERTIGRKLRRITPFPEVLVLIAVGIVLVISVFSGKAIF